MNDEDKIRHSTRLQYSIFKCVQKSAISVCPRTVAYLEKGMTGFHDYTSQRHHAAFRLEEIIPKIFYS